MGTLYRPPPPVPARGGRVRVDGLVALLAGVLSALLPREPREAVVRRYGVEPAFWSLLLGFVEAFGGFFTLVDDYLRRIRGLIDQGTDAALPALERGDVDPLAVMWGGAFAWVRWLTSPWTLFLVMVVLTGGARLVSFAITREAIGEPLVWLGWRLWRGARAPAVSTQHRLRFGPPRPDRVLPTEDGGLLVLASEPRPEWNERVTIQVGERFFRLAEVGEHRAGGLLWHRYRLREEDPTAVIRALLLYEPPDSDSGSATWDGAG